MLGKLIKHEFKATAHAMFGIYLSALITFGAMVLIFFIKNKTLMKTGTAVMIGICAVAMVITLFTIIGTFNKSLYGNQGYLSFTLPVTGKNLLASKTIVSLAWILISFVFVIAVALFLALYWFAQTKSSIKEMLSSAYSMLQGMMNVPDKETAIKTLAVIVVVLFVKALFLIFKVSFSLSLANTKPFQKMNPILAAILIYFAVFIILQGGNVASAYLPVQLSVASHDIGLKIGETMIGLESGAPSFMDMPILGYVFEALVCVVLYFVTGNIMTRRVNIK